MPEVASERIRTAVPDLAKNFNPGDLLLIASHDCDLCCESFEEEPNFEVILCRSIPDESEDGNRWLGKNPRRLQLRIPARQGSLYELDIHDRFSAPRSILVEFEEIDQPSETISHADTAVYRRWLGRRYYRTALPTEFNERSRPAQRYLGEKLKKVGGPITSIYLQIDPREEELGELQRYRVYAHLTVRRVTWESPTGMETALKAQAAVEAAFLSCNGIEFLGAQVIPEAEFSLEDVQECARWDYSDYTSFKPSPPTPLVPET